MEKEIGRIKKNDSTDIIVRIDEYKGKKGLTVREFVKSERYTGFSKAGTRIPVESFLEFRDMINKIDYNDLTSPVESIPKPVTSPDVPAAVNAVKKERKPRKKKEPAAEPIAQPVEEVEEVSEEAKEE